MRGSAQARLFATRAGKDMFSARQLRGELYMSAERPILIVDDDAALRETLSEQLAVDGEFVATEAGSLAEAEEMLNSRDARFDAIILDVSLPDGDGRDFCTRLRRQGQRRR